MFKYNLVFFVLLSTLFMGQSWSAPIILGKDQAPINTLDYEVLKRVAKNSGIPVEKFKHYKRNHYVVGDDGFLYLDIKKNGVIDGEDEAIFDIIVRSRNGYMTNDKGDVTGVSINDSGFYDASILNGFKKIISINLIRNKIKKIELSNLHDLRFLSLRGDEYRDVVSFVNLKNLSFLEINHINVSNFKGFIDLPSLRKMEITGMKFDTFHGIENMPKLKILDITSNKSLAEQKFNNVQGVPKGHQLESLRLSTVTLSKLGGIEVFKNLKRLELWNSNRELMDYSPLSKLKTLEELEMTVLELKNFQFLKDMPNLKKVITHHAPVNSLSGVSEAPSLEHLEINNGKLTKIDHLDGNTELRTLILNTHQIKKIEGVSQLKKLRALGLSLNEIPKIEGLENNVCLERFWVAANPIETFENLYHLPILSEIGIDGTKINEFPDYKNLKRLHNISVDLSQIKGDKERTGYFYIHVPIKEFDIQIRKQTPVSDEERQQYGCI